MQRFAAPCAGLFSAFLVTAVAFAQAPAADFSPDGAWIVADRAPAESLLGLPMVRPPKFVALTLNQRVLEGLLAAAPMERTPQAQAAPLILTLPMPDRTFQRFAIVESPVMQPQLALLFPDIRTYRGQGIDDPAATIRLDLTPLGFHSQVRSPHGSAYIDPLTRGNTLNYACYWKREYTKANDGFLCGVTDADRINPKNDDIAPGFSNGTSLRDYALACAATAEYTAFFGGTVALGQAAIVTAINRVSGVYEDELAVRLTLVSNNNLLVYTNSTTDPYSNGNGSTMLGQNQSNIDSVIGNSNYDIGHVFSTGGGGIASLGVVCVTGFKARGVTGSGSPTGDSFWIDYVAHEMGHQFDADHTFNSTTSNCGGGNRSSSHAYEPGSGSTIMSYAGICDTDDLQAHSDAYFHNDSLGSIISYITGTSCATVTSTGNSVPTVDAGTNYVIPASTPFALTAVGSDANGDPITYCWEERELGAAQTITAADNGTSPMCRSWTGTTSPTRTVLRLSDLLANTNAPGERLYAVNRNPASWRVIVRDNRNGGGAVISDDISLNVVNTGAAFAVTSPNTAVSWASGAQTVTWNVSGSNTNGINCANVKISLSTNGGTTFPTVLLASTPNDGSEVVTIPNTASTQARIKVEAVGNIFFDVSNVNFTIVANTTPVVDAGTNKSVNEGSSVTINGTYVDNDAGQTHSGVFNWADGSTSSATVNQTLNTATGSHTYGDNAVRVVTLTITDNVGASGNDTASVTIVNVSPTLNAGTNRVLQGVCQPLQLNATFTDPGFSVPAAGTTESFTANVQWGDGTTNNPTPSVTNGSPGVLTSGTIAASHTYAAQGVFTVTVTVNDDDAGQDIKQFQVTVNKPDCNANGTSDDCELPGNDCNSNGTLDACEGGCNTNGTPDVCESGGCNTNGVPDACEGGCNTNGTPDICELAGKDCNSNGTLDVCDTVGGAGDCNTNRTPDVCEISGKDCNTNNTLDVCEIAGKDCNANGTLDICDTVGGAGDCNTNRTPDTCEPGGCNTNAVPDICEGGCNTNAVPDACEGGCNSNGVPDACEIAGNDCNTNNTLDACELAGRDCNANGTLDVCDTIGGAGDCNANRTPDSCEIAGNDCNTNLLLDPCELAGNDCNTNLSLDACESGGCNTNGIPDACESGGCNTNGVPDVCEGGCNTNGVPDICEGGCNTNGIPDACELAGNDCNTNLLPDACELSGNDCNTNGTPDTCEPVPCPGDFNHDGRRDGADVALFVNCLIGGSGACNCGELTADGSITTADLAPFVNALLTGTACP